MSSPKTVKLSGNLLFVSAMEVLFIYLAWKTLGYSFRTALMPGIMIAGMLVITTILLARELLGYRRATGDGTGRTVEKEAPLEQMSPEQAAAARAARRQGLLKELEIMGWLVALCVLVYMLGFLIAIPVFMILFLRLRFATPWWKTVTVTAGIVVGVYLIFVVWLNTILYQGLVPALFVPR